MRLLPWGERANPPGCNLPLAPRQPVVAPPHVALLNGGGGEDGWIDGGMVYSVIILSGSSLDEDK